MADLQYTPVEEIAKVRLALSSFSCISSLIALSQIHTSLQAGFKSGKARDIKYRKHQLLQLAYLLKDNKDRFNEAVKRDLGRSYPEHEMYVQERLIPICARSSLRSSIEHYISLEQVKCIFDNFEKWAKPESAEFSIYFGARPHIRKEPKGVVLIFVPFNYPIMLLMSPLVRPLLSSLWLLRVTESCARREPSLRGTPPASKSQNSFQQRARCSSSSSQSTWIRTCTVSSTVTSQSQLRFVPGPTFLYHTLTRGLV